MVRYSISSVSLSPPHFKCATARMRWRASLCWVFSAPMCSLKERRESPQSPRNVVYSSTGSSVSLILIGGGGGGGGGGLWALNWGAVKCTTLHLWAANLNPILVAHSCMAFAATCRCLSMVSRERPRKISYQRHQQDVALCQFQSDNICRQWSWVGGEIEQSDRAVEVKELTPDVLSKALEIQWNMDRETIFYVSRQVV